MQRITRAGRRLSFLLFLGAAFGAGMFTMWVIGNENVLTVAARIVQLIPGVLKVEEGLDIPAATNLEPLATFWEVREKIKRDFVYPIKDEKELTYGAIRGMLAALDDPWTRYQTPEEYQEFQDDTEGHFDGIGAVLESRPVEGSEDDREVVITSIIPEGPAAKADMRPEDVVVEVDDIPVKGMRLDQVVSRIRGKRGTTVKLGLQRKGTQGLVTVEVIRDKIEVPVVEHKMLPNDIGYIWLRQFNKQAAAKLRDALEDLQARKMRGLVFDMSINPGGLLDMAVAVSSMFVEKGQPVVYVQERGREPEPITSRMGPVIPTSVPMVVLVDRGAASASEIVAGCLQDLGRALVVGQNTFGKSKVQTVVELQDKSALILTTAVYLTPKKRDINLEYEPGRRGVKPDRFFPEPEPGTRVQFDKWHAEQIHKAVQVLEEQIAKPEG